MKKKLLIYTCLCLFSILAIRCKDDGSFDNNVFISSSNLETIINKPSVVQDEKTLQIAMAKPESQEVTVEFTVDPAQLAKYNTIYNEKAVELPSSNYTLSGNTLKISPGSVTTDPLSIKFDKINSLDRDITYVLPISISKASLGVLASSSVAYYVVKGGALINVVADLENNNLHIDQWKNPDPVNNLSTLTMEALVRGRNYDRLISTIMGIEGRFLIRVGDANFPSNQIQLATSMGNIPGSDPAKGLPTNQWTHVAVTYEAATGTAKIIVNGKLQSEGTINWLGNVNLGVNGVNGFYIGRSYADDRFFAGDFAECRIWNKVRSIEEIAANPYDVDPNSDGLVAYWKCNEGTGSIVKDHTANENHLTAKSAIKWTTVSLPAK